VNFFPFQAISAWSLSRVVPEAGSTIAFLAPAILLKRDDLPTLGLPTIAILTKLPFFAINHLTIVLCGGLSNILNYFKIMLVKFYHPSFFNHKK
jgi:hypothetical protein